MRPSGEASTRRGTQHKAADRLPELRSRIGYTPGTSSTSSIAELLGSPDSWRIGRRKGPFNGHPNAVETRDMHELSVTQSLLEIAVRHGEKAGAQRITDLYLVIGQLSSIVDDSVSFYWDMISQGTLAEGAKLHFRRVPVEMLCLDCAAHYTPPAGELACPTCSSTRVRVVTGDQLHLESINIES